MPQPAALAVPYRLGFEVRFAPAPLWSIGGDVMVRIELTAPVSEQTQQAYHALITSFFMLASTGALCGDAIEPWRSEVADFQTMASSIDTLNFRLSGCLLDERATVLCANMLALGHDDAPIRRVTLAGAVGYSHATERMLFDGAQTDPYPALYRHLPFPCAFNPTQDAPQVVVELASAPDADAEQTLRDQILTWAAASAGGCYAAVLAPPADCFIAFDPGDIEVVDDEVTIYIAKFRCHEAAVVALVNACAALHPVIGIRAMRVE